VNQQDAADRAPHRSRVKHLHRYRGIVAACVFAVSGLCVGVPARATTIAHTLRIATAEEVATLNPELNTQTIVLYLSQMTAAYAFRLDHENRLSPELATDVPTTRNGGISKDGKTITLHLRKGVKWSDGSPFDADDVAFTIAAINNPSNSVATRHGFDQITQVDEPDKFTVVAHLKSPFGAIVPTLFASNGGLAILPKHILGRLHDMNDVPFNALPVGIGPFRYAAWRRGDQIVLDRNPNYWRGRAALEHIVMKLIPDRNTVLTQLQSGELDLWYPVGGSFFSRVSRIPNVHIIRQPGYAINQVLFNVTGPVLAQRSVRQALRYAVDRRSLREKVGHGIGLLQNVIVPAVDPSTPKDIAFTPFDVAKANAILDAAGWRRGSDGVRQKDGNRLSLALVSSTGTPDADTTIELVRTWWNEIGVQLDVRRYRSEVLFGPYASGGILANGRFDLMFLGQVLPAPFDLTLAYGCKMIPPAGQNYTRSCNPKLDALLAKYDTTYDDSARARLLSQALQTIDDEALVIVTTGREDLFGVNDAVKNFSPNSATPFDDLLQVDVGGS
jgi:peptide/nickel transport system substrate-binding protein